MIYHNNDILRSFLKRGATGAHAVHSAPGGHIDAKQFVFDTGEFEKTRAEVQHQHPHLSPEESAARAAFRLLTHASKASAGTPVPFSPVLPATPVPLPLSPLSHSPLWGTVLKVLWAISILLLLAVIAAKAEPEPESANAVSRETQILALLLRPPALAQFGVQPVNIVFINGAQPGMTGTSLNVNCTGGCGAASSFTDNTVFTNASTAVNPIGGVFNDAITACTSGNACGVRLTSDRMIFVNLGKINGTAPSLTGSSLNVNCTGGCGSSSFADNSTFTFGTTSITNLGGVYNTSITNCTSGNACAPQLTVDRMLYVNWGKVAGTAVSVNNGTTDAGTTRVTLSSDSTGQVKLAASAGTDIGKLDANQSVNAAQIAGTTTSVNNGTTDAGTQRVTLSSDSTGQVKLAASAGTDIGKLDADQTVNVDQIHGTATSVNNGTTDAGTQRVTLSSDSTGQVKLAASAGTDIGKLDANQSVNVAQINGATTSTAASGTQLVGITGHAGGNVDGATGAAPPANAIYPAGLGSGATGGFLIGLPVGDTYKNINISTATTTLLVSGVSGRQVRISALHMIAAGADNVALIEGTGATCGTGTAGMAGGTTAASGYNFAANGGIALGSGLGTVMQTATAGDSVCAVTSAAVQLSGGLQYTIY